MSHHSKRLGVTVPLLDDVATHSLLLHIRSLQSSQFAASLQSMQTTRFNGHTGLASGSLLPYQMGTKRTVSAPKEEAHLMYAKFAFPFACQCLVDSQRLSDLLGHSLLGLVSC